MSIELQSYKDKFTNSSHIVQDALDGCFLEASRVMSSNGLSTYLEGAYALYNLGKSEDLIVTYLEETPLVAKEVGEAIISEIIMSVLKMSSQTSTAILSLMLSSLPFVASRVTDLDLLKDYLKLLEKMIALSPRGVRPMLEHIEELMSKLTLGGLRRWALYGTNAHRRDLKTLEAYFSLQSADALKVLEGERRGTLFVDAHRKLQFYLRAFFDREFFLRPTSGDYENKEGIKAYIEQGIIFIPDAYDDYENITGSDCYRATTAHCAAHIIHTKKAFEASHNGFMLNSLQMACVSLLEDLRVEKICIESFPGLKKLWLNFHPILDEKQAQYNPFILDLLDLSRSILDETHISIKAHNNQIKKKFIQDFEARKDSSDFSYELGLEYYDILKTQTNVKISAGALEKLPISYRDDNRYLWNFKPSDALDLDYVLSKQQQIRKRVSLMEMLNELDCELAGDDSQEVWTLDGELYNDEGQSYNELEGKEPISAPHHYYEWDYKMQIYRPNWVTLYERRAMRGELEQIDGIFKKNRKTATKLKNAIEMLQPQGLVRHKKQIQGAELDIDECVNAMVDIRMGHTPTERLYIDKQKHERDVSVSLLMDLSQSTNDTVIGGDKTILELMQEATLLLSWAINEIGDRFAVTGFASDTRHDVKYYNFKTFQNPWNDEAKERLAGMRGEYSTRMGAAMRHTGEQLYKQKTAKKLLLILTDGAPSDIDVEDPQYLRFDTKMAVEELKAKGIICYCISLDPSAREYVARIFGANRFLIINQIEKLPEKLPMLFISLTK